MESIKFIGFYSHFITTTLDNFYIKKKLGGTIYNYRQKNSVDGKLLNNKVKVLTHDGYIKEKLLGVEYDLVIDTRWSHEENASTTSKLNVDVTPGPLVFPIVLPSPGYNSLKDITESKTMVVTKVVQMYGIIESVYTFTDQYAITTYNELYDGTTGDVILTKTNDEHLQDSYEYTIPAYSISKQKRMGPAYVNLGFKTSIVPLDLDTFCNPDTNAYLNSGQLKHGDQVILYPFNGTPKRAWVELEQKAITKRTPCPDDEIDTTTIPTLVDNRPRPRMLTGWYDAYGAVCGEELDIDSSKYLKGQKGEILEEALIYHLNEKFADSINALSYPIIIDSNNITKNVSPDIARFLLPHEPYKVEHQRFCETFDSVLYPADPPYLVPSVFSGGVDLNYGIENLRDYNETFEVLFDMTDPISAAVEHIEVSSKSTHGNMCEHHFTHYDKRRKPYWEYTKSYNACLSYYKSQERFYSPSYLYYNPNKWAANADSSGYNSLKNHYLKSMCDLPTYRKLYGPIDSIDIYPARRALKASTYSRTMFRIRYDSATDQHLNKYIDSIQLFLIKYNIKLPNGDTSSIHYIEKGRKLREGERSPFSANKDFKDCDYDYSPYEYDVWGYTTDDTPSDTTEYTPKPVCTINFRLLDAEGAYIPHLNVLDSIKVIQSGNRNQLSASAGRLVSTSFPLKIDYYDSSFVGLKTASDGLEIIQAEGLTFSEGQLVTQAYDIQANQFLEGIDGVFRVDSSLRYLSPRYQKSSIETSKDGYMEELPQLWKKGRCNDNAFPPSWEESSGWFLNSSTTKYGSNGNAEEARNNLDIYSAQFQNAYGSVEATANNCAQNNMAYDNFEQYYSFGTSSSQVKPNFRAIDVRGYENSTNLLTANNINYELIEYPSLNKLVDGVAHTGKTSLFLKGDNLEQTNVIVSDSLISMIPLEQVGLASQLVDSRLIDTINYASASLTHYTQFTKNLKTTVSDKINLLKTNGVNKDSITILPDSSNGNFKPDTGEYVFSIWMKELITSGTRYAGTSPEIEIISNGSSKILKATGSMIDGWMKIEGTFTYSPSFPLYIILKGGLWGAFYDDLRIHPFASNMNTYLYDRYTNRLKAKLDENNYATFYEYDEEGIPSQVKRETAIGIVTISESRQSQNKHPIQ